ncbi:palmitoyltransferase, putative [Plasmodium gallinaceum]|uniref:Palmitoyltransferase n=1 Tax=Plasmodium gallinaceum TaxID=5849 RepID=A0A1J1GSM7_PLAGA|nr:palmitoyltransferase, putative [Plasmodium gallinaceum]CRG95444.1 palmitoyltransferase, putative [Plasmodium gallinaceum]
MNTLKSYMNLIFLKANHYFQFYYSFSMYVKIKKKIIFEIEKETYFILERYYNTSCNSFFCMLIFISGFSSFLLCSLSDPGKISSKYLDKHLKFYPYDGIIFHKDSECETCKIKKPARSKHCKYCSSCISRYDHHCFLLNNCIGGYNNVYFIIFICVNIIITFYSSYISLYSVIKYENLLEATFINHKTNEILPNSYLTIVNYLFSEYSATFSLFIISISTFFCILLFFLHEIYLNFYVNMTNNEKAKYNKLKNSNLHRNKNFYSFIRNVNDALFYKKNIENFPKKFS